MANENDWRSNYSGDSSKYLSYFQDEQQFLDMDFTSINDARSDFYKNSGQFTAMDNASLSKEFNSLHAMQAGGRLARTEMHGAAAVAREQRAKNPSKSAVLGSLADYGAPKGDGAVVLGGLNNGQNKTILGDF